MEGAEPQTMVAIIQSPGDASLAVAFMSTPRSNYTNRRSRKAPSVSKLSVKTNTEVTKRTISTQNCSAHYTSSYQLSHCRLKPTAPLCEVSEFPLQRGTPSRTRGNFTVGMCGSRESTSSRAKRLRGSYSFSRCSPLLSGSFVESLRKYPLAGKSASTELVQRLLNYTQAKHTDSRNNSQNKRSIALSPCTSKHTNKQINKANKNLQTYTRTNKEMPAVKEKTPRKKYNKKNKSIDTILKSSFASDQLRESLNRLKQSTRGRPINISRNAEVRNLNDIKRCIQDAIIQMSEEAGTRCPKVERRRETCSKTCPNTEMCHEECRSSPHQSASYTNREDDQNIQNYDYLNPPLPGGPSNVCKCNDDISWKDLQSYIRKTVRQIMDGAPCSTRPCPYIESRYREHRKLHHQKDRATSPDQDVRKEILSKRGSMDDDSTEAFSRGEMGSSLIPRCICKSHKRKSILDLYGSSDEYDSDRASEEDNDIKEGVMSWLLKLPAYADNTEENQAAIQDMVPAFISALKDAKYAPDSDKKVMDEIQNFLNILPVDENSEEEEDEYEEIKEFIQLWLDNIDWDLRTKDGRSIKKEQLLDTLMRRLEPIVTDSGTAEELNDELLAILPEYKKYSSEGSNFSKQVHENADNLVSALSAIISQKKDKKKRKIKFKFLQPIFKWLTENDKISKAVKNNIQQSAAREELKLVEMITEHADNNAIMNEMDNFLETIPQVQLNAEEKSLLAENILKEIRVPSKMDSNQKMRHAKDLMKYIRQRKSDKSGEKSKTSKQPVSDWLNNNPKISDKTKKKYRNLANKVDKKIKQMKTQNVKDELIGKEITDFIDTLSAQGVPFTTKEKNDLTSNLLKREKSKQGSSFEELKMLRNASEPILDWLNKVSQISLETKQKHQSLAKNFDKKIQQMKSQYVDDDIINEEIANFVESLSSADKPLSTKQKKELTKDLIKEVKSMPTETTLKPALTWLKTVPNIPKESRMKIENTFKNFDENLQQMKAENLDINVIKDEITDFVDTLSEKGLQLTPDQKNYLTRNLTEAAKPLLSNINEKPVLNVLDSVPYIPKEIKQKNKHAITEFEKKLQQLKAQSVDNDTINKEIRDFVDSISSRDKPLTSKQKSDLTEDLIREIKSIPTKKNILPASDWLKNAPNIPIKIKMRNENTFKNFDNNLQQMKAENLDTDVIEDEIAKFVDSLSEKGIQLTPKQKNELTKNIAFSEENTLPVSKVLDSVPYIPKEIKQKNQRDIKEFEKKIQQLKAQSVDDDTINEEIRDFVDSILYKDKPLTSKQKSELTKDLVKEVKLIPTETNIKPASNWLKNAPNIPREIKIKNANTFKNFDRNLQQRKAENLDTDVIEDEIAHFVDSLPEKGIHLTPEQKNDLTKKLTFSEEKRLPVSEVIDSASYIPKEIKQKNQRAITEFEKKLQQLKAQSVDDDTINEEIRNFVDTISYKDKPLTSKQKNELTKDLIGEVKSVPTTTTNIEPASDWLKSAPNIIPREIKMKTDNTFKKFDRNLEQMKAENLDTDVIENEFANFIDSLPEKGIHLTTEQKNDRTKKLTFSEEKIIPVSKVIDSAPYIPKEIKQKNQRAIMEFEKKHQELKAQNFDNDTINKDIKEFVDSISYGDKPLTSKQKSELTKDLIKEVKSMPTGRNVEPALDWLRNASNITKEIKMKNENTFKSFDKNLQEMKAGNLDSDVIEDEIANFVDSLPEKGIKLTSKQKDDLTKELTFSEEKNQPVSKVLDSASLIPKEIKKNNQRAIKEFEKKIQQLEAQRVDDDTINEEIRDFVDSISSEDKPLTTKQKSELIKDLKKEVKSLPTESHVNIISKPITSGEKKQPVSNILYSSQYNPKEIKNQRVETNREPASNWLNIAPTIPNDIKEKNENLFKKFDKELHQMKSENIDDDVIENEISIFVDSLPAKGIKLTPQQRTDLKENLRSKAIKQNGTDWINNAPNISEKKNRNLAKVIDKKLQETLKPSPSLQPVSTWLKNDPNIPKEVKRKHRRSAEIFDSKLQDMNTRRISEEIIEDEIKNFLGELPGIRLTAKQKNALGRAIVKEMRPEKSKQPLSDWLDSEPNISEEIKKQNRSSINEFDKKLLKLHLLNTSYDVMLKQIKDYLDLLPDRGIPMTPKERDKLAKRILNQIKGIMTASTSNFLLGDGLDDIDSTDLDLSAILDPEMVRREIGNILEGFEIPADIADELEKNIADALADQIANGLSEDEMRKKLMKILKDANISEDQAIEIIEKLLTKNKELQANSAPSTMIKQEAIKKEFGNIFDGLDIPIDIADKCGNNIADILAEQIAKGLSDEETKERLMAMFKDANVPEDQAKEMVDKILKENKEMQAKVPDMKNKVDNILEEFGIHADIADDVEQDIADVLADQITYGLSDEETRKKLMSILRNNNIPEDEANEIIDKLLKKNKELQVVSKSFLCPRKKRVSERSFDKPSKGFDLSTLNLMFEPREIIEEKVIGSLLVWLKEQPFYQDSPPNDQKIQEDSFKNFAKNLITIIEKSSLQSNIDASLLKEIKKCVQKLPMNTKFKSNDQFINEILPQQILDFLKNSKIVDNIKKWVEVKEKDVIAPKQQEIPENKAKLLAAADQFIGEAVDRWMPELTLPKKDKEHMNKARDCLVKTLTNNFIENGGEIPLNKQKEIFVNATAQFLENFPGHRYNKSENVENLANLLKDKFNELRCKYLSQSVSKKGADMLLDGIAYWAKSLPIESETPDECAGAEHMKQVIKDKLIHKIGELNMNPEVFNDDFLYEDLLEEEVDRLLTKLPSENVKKQLPKLKKDFMQIVRNARKKIHDENAGQIYKQQLRDVITMTLPCFNLISPESRASFEVLKDNVVDAFICMHYVGSDPDEIEKLKMKINKEVYSFCATYLRRCPAEPINTVTLNEELLGALKEITEPQNYSFLDEVALLKLKDVIKDWVKELPLKYQSGLKKLQTSKMISLLAKKLHEMEKEVQIMSTCDNVSKMEKEIIKFLNKITLATDRYEDMDLFANNLIERLRVTEERRKLDASARHSVDLICPGICTRPVPPCALSREDLDHLERIRRRCGLRQMLLKDVADNPCSVETGCQTCSKSRNFGVSPSRGHIDCKTFSGQTPRRTTQAIGSQMHVSPNVNINEHPWDSLDDTCYRPKPYFGKTIPRRLPRSPCDSSKPFQISSRKSQLCSTRSPIKQCSSRQQIRIPCQFPSKYQYRPEQAQAGNQCPPDSSYFYNDDSNQLSTNSAEQGTQSDRPDLSYLSSDQSSSHRRASTPADNLYNVSSPPNRAEQSSQRSQAVFYPRSRCDLLREKAARECMTKQYRPCTSPRRHQDPPCMPKSRCIRSSTSPFSSEDREPEPSRFQDRAYLGSFHQREEPDIPLSGFHIPDFEYWERDRNLHYDHGFQRRCKLKSGKHDRRSRCSQPHQSMSSCGKCCGVHCPHPSYMFFR